jgi:hypothetical protein
MQDMYMRLNDKVMIVLSSFAGDHGGLAAQLLVLAFMERCQHWLRANQ